LGRGRRGFSAPRFLLASPQQERAMDLPQVFIFDAGWIFFAAWGMVVAGLGIFAFGRDVLASAGWKKYSSRGRA